MSKNGMGGPTYDAVISALDQMGNEMPDVIIISEATFKLLVEELNYPGYRDDTKFVGYFVGVPVWIDDRFDQPVFISGK